MKKLFLLIFIMYFISSCGSKNDKASESATATMSQKELQYYSNGKKLYETFCSNCHTEQGVGLGKLIPPLKASNYLMADLNRAARIIKYGQKGPITVNQVEYNQPMPANPKLTDLEIAELVTYISNSWGNSADGFTIEEVKKSFEEAGN